LNKKEFHFSDELMQNIISLTEGMIDEMSFEKSISLLEKEASKYFFNESAEGNLLRILNSLFDRVSFFKEIKNYPHHAEILIGIVSNSNYLTDIVVQNPEYLYQLFNDEYLNQQIYYDDLQFELKQGISKFKSFDARIKFIRKFKKRYVLKIGMQDILGIKTLKEITEELSFLARAIISVLFDLCYSEVLLSNKVKKIDSKFSICSLGKLGGNELNYSSDVDLIIFYDKNITIKNCRKDFHELLSETIQLFTKISTQITYQGFIYRIDFRLRPDGKYSPLCKSVLDYIKYYETRGEDWEKQMLIKLNFISGDYNLYNQFKRFVDSYVYQMNLSSSVNEKIIQMKRTIEKHHHADDVKTFEGGIRDIEFSVQALQLLNGNKIIELRNGNTLDTLEILLQKKLISQKEYSTLNEAYIFYRRIEHFLQLMNDTQTHKIPEDINLLKKLSIYSGFQSVEKFKKEIDKKRKEVRKVFNSILSASKEEDVFNKINFNDKIKAEANFNYLKTGKGIVDRKEFDSRTIELYNKNEKYLLEYLQKSKEPDRVLEKFSKVIRFSKYPSIWYNEFQNQKYFEQFLNLCSYSQRSINLLAESNDLSDLFLSRRVFIKNIEDEFENLSTKEIVFILSVQFALKLKGWKEVSKIFCDYFSLHIDRISSPLNKKYKFFIAGLGSFGANLMSFSSDIDLIVVSDKVKTDLKIQEAFQDLLQKLKKEFAPFEVDFRLRPEGKKSPLVWDIENYQKYLESRAKVWEFQSLTKIKFVSGDKKLFDRFKKILISSVKKFDSKLIKEEIKKMHIAFVSKGSAFQNHIHPKTCKGGLATIDFIFQSEILMNEKYFYESINKNYISIIEFISKTENDFETLSENYSFFKKMELAIQNIFDATFSVKENQYNIKLLSSFLDFENDSDFLLKYGNLKKQNIQIFEKYFGEK